MDIHIERLRSRFSISPAEERIIRALPSAEEEYAADSILVRAMQEQFECKILLHGMVVRQKGLRNGARQITELNVPGDPIDLHSFTLKRLDHDISALSKCRVARVPHERLRTMMEEHPRLALIYWFGTNLDAAIHREWELSLGRRLALSRMAHLFCELHARLEIVGLTRNISYELPINQTELGECLGLTAVHVNRTLQQLREQGLCDFRDHRVTIHDLPGLKVLGDFDPCYLYLGPQPL